MLILFIGGNGLIWSKVDYRGGHCGNSLSLTLMGIVLHLVAQHGQTVGFLTVIAVHGATQDYFSFTMWGLSNRIDIACIMKSEKIWRHYRKNSLSNENLKNYSMGLNPDKKLDIAFGS